MGLSEHVARIIGYAYTLGAHLDLLLGLLARDVESLKTVIRKGYLQHHRRLTDAWLATEQNQ